MFDRDAAICNEQAQRDRYGHMAKALHQLDNVHPRPLDEAIIASETRKKKTMKEGNQIYYLDFEATDKTPMTCRITQIGCVTTQADGTVLEFQTLVKADQKICDKAVEITGITNEMLKDAPPCKEALQKFFAWIDETRHDNNVTFVAHNGSGFDYPLLLSEMWRWSLHPYTVLSRHGVTRLFDSLYWARINLPSHKLIKNSEGRGSLKLGDIHESLLGNRFDNAHDAVADCHALRRVCESSYCTRKKIDMNEPDGHICMTLRECIDRFQSKRENIDKTRQQKIKRKISESAKCATLSMFMPRKRKQES